MTASSTKIQLIGALCVVVLGLVWIDRLAEKTPLQAPAGEAGRDPGAVGER